MNLEEILPFLTTAQRGNMLRIALDNVGEPPSQSTKRSRSPSPETVPPRRNLRPRRNRLSYAPADPKEFDTDSTEDAPSTPKQPNKKVTKDHTITSNTPSTGITISLVSRADENITVEPRINSNPLPASDTSPTSEIKTEVKTQDGSPDIKSTPEDERMVLSIIDKIASLEAQKLDALFAVVISKTNEREETLMAELANSDKKLDEDLQGLMKRLDDRVMEMKISKTEILEHLVKNRDILKGLIDSKKSGESSLANTNFHKDPLLGPLADTNMVSSENLYETLKRVDDHIAKLTKRTDGLFRSLEERKSEIKRLMGGKLQMQAEIPDEDYEESRVEKNHEDGGESDREPVAMDDEHDGIVDKTSVSEDDNCDDGDKDESEETTGTEDDEHDADDDEDCEIDETSEDEIKGFIVSDDSEDYDYED